MNANVTPDSLRPITPKSIYLVRLYLTLIICSLGAFWARNGPMSIHGYEIIGGSIAIGLIAIAASFIRVRGCFIFILAVMVVLPSSYAFGMDFLVLKWTWWEWLIIAPAQVGLPVIWVIYLSRAKRVITFYSTRRIEPSNPIK